jgi:hypothetical protein
VYKDYTDEESLMRGLVAGAWLAPVILLLGIATGSSLLLWSKQHNNASPFGNQPK